MSKLDANGSADTVPAPSGTSDAAATFLALALDLPGCTMTPLLKASAQYARAQLAGMTCYDEARRVGKASLSRSLAFTNTLLPSGRRHCLQEPFRKCVGSNPTAHRQLLIEYCCCTLRG